MLCAVDWSFPLTDTCVRRAGNFSLVNQFMYYCYSGKYTSLCDVWSFGILMWEVFSAGKTPYSGMKNQEARDRVDNGMYSIMSSISFRVLP